MIKGIAQFEHKIGERVYHFYCENDAPLGEVFDSLTKFKMHVTGLIQASEQKQEKKEDTKAE